MHERPHKCTPTSKHMNNKRHARIGKWLNTFLAAMWLVTNLAVFVVALEAMIVPKSEGGVFEKGNWVLDACKQLHTWLQDKDLYIGIMAVLDYSQLAVEMQQWASGTSSRWRFPLGFRAHELCACVLFSILPCVRDLEQDPLHNKRLPYTRREGWLQVHDVEFEAGREARRDPSMRVKPGSEESLQGHAESLTQLEEYGLDLMRRMHQEGEDTDLWNTALSEWRKEAAARKEARRRAGKTSDACMFCNQGGVLMMCEYDTCPHAAHLQCTGLSEDPDEWVCNMCKNKHK
jgi:hypothetical protein